MAADIRVSRRRFLKWGLALAGGSAVSAGGSYAYATNIEPRWLRTEHVRLTLRRLPPAFHKYRIVQFSDIHMGYPLGRDMLRQIVDTANQQQPDLVAITGDFVSYAPESVAPDLVAELTRLRATDGVVGVLGNHDVWAGADAVRAIMRDSNVADIGNDVKVVSRRGEFLAIAGVDDVWEGLDRLDMVLAKLPSAGSSVLLAHEPDFADTSAPTGRFDLQISGHSHGGQVNLPLVGPLVRKPYGKRYPIGHYRVGNMHQYTNRGVGTSGMNIRFNCRPELTVFTLQSPGLA